MGAPSARVIAAQLTLTAIDNCPETTRDTMTEMFQSRVSDAKREKVVAALEKLNNKHRERMNKIVQKYHDAQAEKAAKPADAPKKAFPGRKK